MSLIKWTTVLSETSPATAGTVVADRIFGGLQQYSWFVIDAELTGATGGTLDVYLQRKAPGTGIWYDYLHFPQVAAGAGAAYYTVQPQAIQGITVVGKGTTPALAANTCTGGHPGAELRCVFVAGAGTSAGATQVIRITGLVEQ